MFACLPKLIHGVDVVFNHLDEESVDVNLHSWMECMPRVLREQESLGYLACLVRGRCCAKNAFCMVFADNAAMDAQGRRLRREV
uniref:Uncharacterized protein n=1 Tax=Arundo donax TaxID=35708 RepID=A0A0A9EJ07_ARUDO